MFENHESSINILKNFPNKQFKWIVSSSIDKKVLIWDLDLNETIFELKNLTSPANEINIIKDNIQVLCKDGTFRLYNGNNGSLVEVYMSPKSDLLFA